MFNYTCLNQIAGVGLDLFSDDYKKVDDIKDADAALVRSAAMHDMELGDKVLAVARAGAGVNNIPLDKCGLMVSQGRSFMQTAPWVVIAPGLAIFITVLVFNMLGDTLSDITGRQ